MASVTSKALAVGQKRKAGAPPNSAARKRQKAHDARAIPVQSADAALSTSGELNVAAFIKAREFEINSLDRSIQKSKTALTTRAFQQIPRNMRRRTASHNVKKVPRRLRRRAEREVEQMKEDNTPTVTARRRTPSRRLRLRLETAMAVQALNKKSKTVRQRKKDSKEAKKNAKKMDPEDHISISRVSKLKKNTLLEPPKATSKFKRRQVNKTWLPTHLWHAKRAHMTKSTEPLWRMALPIAPTEKSYRPSHRAGGSRGCIAWDMSYISTIGCQGAEASLEGMLKAIGFAGEGWAGAKCKRWKKGTRSSLGWVFERDNERETIGPASVIWSVESEIEQAANNALPTEQQEDTAMTGVAANTRKKVKVASRKLFIRVHPSIFYSLWLELIKVAKMQRPQVLLEDLRFQIGSVEVTGPGSTEALLAVLKPIARSDPNSVEIVWKSLVGVTNPAALPQNATMCFNIADPRLSTQTKKTAVPINESTMHTLNELLIAWPPDMTKTAGDIFSHKRRHLAALSMSSQKAINRRKSDAGPGKSLVATDKDPKVPVMLVASKAPPNSSNEQGTWTVILPWRCVDSVWRSLVYYSLTTGGTPRFGGLDQLRQMSFEHGQPWFPGDAAGTAAGQAWERTESEQKFDEWMRKPPSRRVAWDVVDLGNGKKGEHGNGWTCDYEFLFRQGEEDIDASASFATNGGEGDLPNAGVIDDPTPKLLTQRQRKAARSKAKQAVEKDSRRRNTSSPESDAPEDFQVDSDMLGSTKMAYLPNPQATMLFKTPSKARLPTIRALTTIRITLLNRGTPSHAARIYRLPSGSSKDATQLRKKWLEFDPRLQNDRNSIKHTARSKMKKDKRNRHKLPRSHSARPQEALSHVQYLPPDAHPDVVAQYGPKATPENSSAVIEDDRKEQLRKLMFPYMTVEESQRHPACPDVDDLIGFVTTGAYNLAEGRGTAIGNIWVQKVLEGWRDEEKESGGLVTDKGKEREMHLCIVRNAGEGVGRLGLWELC